MAADVFPKVNFFPVVNFEEHGVCVFLHVRWCVTGGYTDHEAAGG